ncbi:hypothetical protein SKAU_G00098140 [Synaphobranchus kaupii]|uniref:PiggyBac transposable element-derived protein domain-containing protein n=1 Tax=Synaphobranchus kaupii TaxID=118154 RepID=A0A9Q1FZ10_SYNKA|nr:hypothetical protein SKAU_G00098140 [Synaphobranchus kaupii]
MDVDADDYSCLLQSLKRRRALTSDELRVIAEHDMDDHQGMHCVEEDALDAELLQAQVQTEELEEEEEDDEMDCDLEPRRASEGRPLGLDLGSVRRAVRLTTSVMLREIDFFMLFFTQAIVADICGFTNRQGWELVLNRASYAGVEGVWNEVTPDEFYRFMGLLIYMGFHVLPDMHRYWGTKSLQGSWARSFMSRDRFKALLAALHVVDPATEDNQDRLKKLRYLMDHLKQKCQELFQPNQNLAIDERMVKSKAKASRDAISYFGYLKKIYVLFSASVQRWAILKKHVPISVKSWAETRWESRIKSVEALRYQAAEVREALLAVRDKATDGNIRIEAQSLAEEVGSYRFSVCSVVWYDILAKIQHVSKLMQSSEMQLDVAVDLLRETQ